MQDGMYSQLRVKPAENGWTLCWEEKVMNPMAPMSTYGDSYTYHSKKMVFETSKDVSMEQALDKAMDKYKSLLLADMPSQMGEKKGA